MVSLALALALAACFRTYPPSPAEQAQARARQAASDRAAAAERRWKAEQKAAERERVARLYANARYGDIIECAIDGGLVDFHPGWRKYQTSVVTLVRGEAKEVRIRSDSGSRTQRFWASLNDAGNQVTLCDGGPSASYPDCATISGLWAEFSRGIRQKISLKEVFSGATARCAYRGGGRALFDRHRDDRHRDDRRQR